MDILVIAEFMHSDKAFLAPHTMPPARRLGVHKELGGNTARRADPHRIKGMFHTIWYHTQHKKLRMKEKGRTQSDDACLPNTLLCVIEPCSGAG